MIAGFATAEGSARFRDRLPALRNAGHFRRPEWAAGVGELWLSSIGLGTYLGETDDASDRLYAEAITAALRSGVNVLDSAINYRHQHSERNIGAALTRLISAGELARDELLVCTKGGFLSFEGAMPSDPRAYFAREYIEPGILDPAQVARGMHCMAPRYLADQLERSRRNLQLETIDVFYVHNPETQLGAVTNEIFFQRLTEAFAELEKAVAAGKIRWYGVATWNAFRVAPNQRDYVSMEAVLEAARAAGGEDHHFRFVQMPFSLAMPQAFSLRNQKLVKENEVVAPLEFARKRGIGVMGSATLQQGQLTAALPEFIGEALGMASDTENAIQFARSAPALVTALIGMGRPEHVAVNLAVATRPTAPFAQWKRLFAR